MIHAFCEGTRRLTRCAPALAFQDSMAFQYEIIEAGVGLRAKPWIRRLADSSKSSDSGVDRRDRPITA